MFFYTKCYSEAKGNINVYETDTNSMKLDKSLLYENGPEAFICTSMAATAVPACLSSCPCWKVGVITHTCSMSKYHQDKST